MSNDIKSERFKFWDNIKGILIILVVFAHFLYDLQDKALTNLIVDMIYMFHMPAFAFTSGYFSKKENCRNKNSILKLFIAYIILNSIMMLCDAYIGKPIFISYPHYSSWYLIALITWRMLAPHLVKVKKIIPILVAISLVSGFWSELDNQYAIIRIINFFPFFMAGYMLSAEKIKKIRDIKLSNRIIMFICFAILTLTLQVVAFTTFKYSDNALLGFNYSNFGVFDAIGRITLIVISTFSIICLLLGSIEKNIPILTTAGKNSLIIYLFHRPFTLMFAKIVSKYNCTQQITLALICTIILVVIFERDFISKITNNFLNNCVNLILKKENKTKSEKILMRIFIIFLAFLLVIFTSLKTVEFKKITTVSPNEDKIFRVIDENTKNEYDNAFKLVFSGDLILLEDQVKSAYNGENYDFSESFKYTSKYIQSADYSIGVFEGPLGKGIKNYSSSNYADGKELYINFPDEWAKSVQEAGFDLVTTANNHALDADKAGLERTIDILNEINLDFIGTFKNNEDKQNNKVKIVEVDNIKMAILSYTYGINNYTEEDLVNGEMSYSTSMIVSPDSPNYKSVKETIKKDFEIAKSYNPDLIIVLPHWGTQFANEPDDFQLTWQNNFIEYGANIILGDHTHSVQPVTITSNSNGNNVFTLYSPGNYANIFREYNGDCSALVEVYINKESKEVIGGAIIPMWTYSTYTGNYKAVPIYDLLTDENLGKEITTHDLERIKEVQKHITKIMLNEEMDINNIQEKYYFDKDGFMRTKTKNIELTETMKSGKAYPILSNAKTVCFVGDSVTEGTKNGGTGWFEPMEHLISGKIINMGWGSSTTKTLLTDHMEEISNVKADLFVIAIGTNDIRYRNPQICAMNSEQYISNLQELKNNILINNPNANFIFIPPWYATDGDKVSKLNYKDKLQKNKEYTDALSKWVKEQGDIFIDPNITIKETLDKYKHSIYLTDYIHPNSTKGVALYSKAFLEYK